MNNYLFANLATGKLSGKRGGGTPVFTLGEENPTQIYFLDYLKPESYIPTSYPPLGDAFTFSALPINKNDSTLELRVGAGIDSAIIKQSSWSNLPDSLSGVFTSNYTQLEEEFPPGSGNRDLLAGSIGINGRITLTPSPFFGAFRIRAAYRIATFEGRNWGQWGYYVSDIKYTKWVYIPYYASEIDIANALEEVYSGLIDFKVFSSLEELEVLEAPEPPDPANRQPGINEIFSQQLQAREFTLRGQEFKLNQQRYNLERKNTKNVFVFVVQAGDSSFFYSIQGTTLFTAEKGSLLKPPFISFKDATNVEIDTSELAAPSGKYSTLNFNNPQWEGLLGDANEKEIWIDAVLDNRVVAQGRAILRKKLSV